MRVSLHTRRTCRSLFACARGVAHSARRVSIVLFLAVLLLLQGCCCSDLEMAEAGYRNNLSELDEAIEVTSGKTAKGLKKEKKWYQKKYKKLPKDDTKRVAALEKLNKRMDDKLLEYEDDIDKEKAKSEAASDAARDAWFDKHRGDWRDSEDIDDRYTMRVHIWAGRVEYRRASDGGGSSRNVTAPITKTSATSFSAGAMGLETTFKIDKPPRKVDGVWKMTIDGKELQRVD